MNTKTFASQGKQEGQAALFSPGSMDPRCARGSSRRLPGGGLHWRGRAEGECDAAEVGGSGEAPSWKCGHR